MTKIGITLGDPAGIGYEISIKAISRLGTKYPRVDFVLFGNKKHLIKVASLIAFDPLKLKNVQMYDIEGNEIEFGKVQKEAGRISYKSFEEAVKLALKGEIDAIATAPINKKAWELMGSKYIDHTTMLADMVNTKNISTVFEVKKMRVTFLTKHLPLIEACKKVKKDNIIDGIKTADLSLRLLGIKNGKIAVAALNPHAGESGLLGREEIDEIIPAINEVKNQYDVYGPIPADSVFYQASQGMYDIVLSLYHDQGHIAAKTYDFKRTISLNLGAPFLRTSVDHGTAFDIAGKMIADETSMYESIRKAIKYATVYKENYQMYKDRLSELI